MVSRTALLFLWLLLLPLPAGAADNLRMREGISFFHDLDVGFPIVADKIDDCALASGHPTIVFFGACGDLNTNRQAKRIVDLYKRFKGQLVKFVVIDVDRPVNADAKNLVRNYYPGYIPAEVVFDKSGKQSWNHTGEAETGTIEKQISKAL